MTLAGMLMMRRDQRPGLIYNYGSKLTVTPTTNTNTTNTNTTTNTTTTTNTMLTVTHCQGFHHIWPGYLVVKLCLEFQ